MLSDAPIQGADMSQLRLQTQAIAEIAVRSGRGFHVPYFHEAVARGYLKPILVAGRKYYHEDDIEAFAKKWGEKQQQQGAAT